MVDSKDRRIGRPVSMTDAEYTAAAARAAIGRESFSAYVRRLITEDIARRKASAAVK